MYKVFLRIWAFFIYIVLRIILYKYVIGVAACNYRKFTLIFAESPYHNLSYILAEYNEDTRVIKIDFANKYGWSRDYIIDLKEPDWVLSKSIFMLKSSFIAHKDLFYIYKYAFKHWISMFIRRDNYNFWKLYYDI